MPRLSAPINTFDAGEWSPELYGRTDLEKYPSSQRICSNFIPLTHGPVTRRPGTRYVAKTKASGGITKAGRLIPFEVSTERAYVIEATDLAMRFFVDRGRLESPPGTPVELTTPYVLAALGNLKWAQSADVLYLVHNDYAPHKLKRISASRFTIEQIEFRDGPYLDMNLGNVTIAPSGTAIDAAITLTAAPNTKTVLGVTNNGAGLCRVNITAHGWATNDKVDLSAILGTVEANGEWTVTRVDANNFDLQNSVFVNAYVSGGTAHSAVFKSTDVGRIVRIRHSSTWGYAKITGFTNVYTVNAVVKSTFAASTAVTTWRLGAWSDTTGWPGCVTFHEERLFLANCRNQPQTLWASMSGDYENFANSDTGGLVTSDSGLTWTIADDQVNAIRWLSAGKVLNVGTSGGEFTVQASSLNEGITPTNITVRREGTIGSADRNALRLGRAVVHAQYAARKLYSTAYAFDKDAWVSNELTLLWRHLSRAGIVDRAFQKEPWSIIWLVMGDGTLVGFTYLEEPLKMAAHRHPLGGTDVEVLSVAAIPGENQDELWLLVARQINGATVHFVEYMEYEYVPVDKNDKSNWFFVDAGLTHDVGGGPAVTTISGLDHLEGETVSILADGATHPTRVVAGGQITLARPARKVQVGLGYVSRLVTQDLEPGSSSGSTMGKPRRIDKVRVRLLNTLGGYVGTYKEEGDGALEEILMRSGSDPMDTSPPLFSGVKKVTFPQGWGNEAIVQAVQAQPLPMTISAMVPEVSYV